MGLREQIASLAADFASAVMTAIRSSSLDELVGDGSSPSHAATDVPARRGRPAGSKNKSPSGRLPRRSAEDIDAMADRIVAYVKEHGSMRAEQIRTDLEIDKKEWMKPLQLALDTKGLKKQGNKRATEYSVGGATSAKAAPKAKPAKRVTKKAMKAKVKTKHKAKAAPKKAAPKKKAASKKVKAKAASKPNGVSSLHDDHEDSTPDLESAGAE
jgi:hypothetical protein